MRYRLINPLLCRRCGSLLRLAEKDLVLYKAAGFFQENSTLLSQCAYCIGRRKRVDIKYELPRRIDAGYPCGVITALPGNTFTETEWIEPLARPEPAIGSDKDSPFAHLTETERTELNGIAVWLCSVLARRAELGDVAFDTKPIPRYTKVFFDIGTEELRARHDGHAIKAVFDYWISENCPQHWHLAVAMLFREAFTLAATFKDNVTIRQSLIQLLGLDASGRSLMRHLRRSGG